jgi:hypothetical protein
MSYTLSMGYRWYDTPRGKVIVLMYFINSVPYTYDNIEHNDLDSSDIILEASSERTYTEDEIYWASFYLIEEQAHPLLFELDLENPELLPVD